MIRANEGVSVQASLERLAERSEVSVAVWLTLRALRRRMLRGELPHLDMVRDPRARVTSVSIGGRQPHATTDMFNMKHWGVGTECGTVRCIGGEIARVIGVDPCTLMLRFPELKHLFQPNLRVLDHNRAWNDLTDAEAARAIDRFTMTAVGFDPWDESVHPVAA